MATQNDFENSQVKNVPSLNQEKKEITLKLTTSSALDIRKGRYFRFTMKEKKKLFPVSIASEDWQRPLTPSKTEEPGQQMQSLLVNIGGIEIWVHHSYPKYILIRYHELFYRPTNGLDHGKRHIRCQIHLQASEAREKAMCTATEQPWGREIQCQVRKRTCSF